MLNFLKEFRKSLLIDPEEIQNEKTYRKALILLDNATCHSTVPIRSWAKETGVILLYNLPYFSKSNPIELFFGNLKQRCKSMSTSSPLKLAEYLVKKIQTIPKKNYEGYFR